MLTPLTRSQLFFVKPTITKQSYPTNNPTVHHFSISITISLAGDLQNSEDQFHFEFLVSCLWLPLLDHTNESTFASPWEATVTSTTDACALGEENVVGEFRLTKGCCVFFVEKTTGHFVCG